MRTQTDMSGTPPARKHRRSLPRFGEVNVAIGPPVCDMGSVFTAVIAWPVLSEAHAEAAIALMRQEGPCTSADHNMTAYRVAVHGSKIAKGYDDDGEARGGQRLLGCLTKEKATDVAVVVSRVWVAAPAARNRACLELGS